MVTNSHIRTDPTGGVKIKILNIDTEEEEVFQFDSPRKFRLVCFDSKGCPKIFGELPLKAIRKSSKSWSEDWASCQDITGLKVALMEYCPEVSAETLLEFAKNGASVRQGVQQEYGKKEGSVIFAILWPMFKALMHRLQQAMMTPITAWQFVQSPGKGIDSILGWLFRR